MLLKSEKKQGFWIGLFYGLVPHIGCIAFIIFTVSGVTVATALFKPLMMSRYFFHILLGLSIIFATISALLYFKKQGFITFNKNEGGLEIGFIRGGLKRKWKYLLTLYGTTVGINLLLFMLIFPVLATLDAEKGLSFATVANVFLDREVKTENSLPSITLKVDIPCPGHAPLITGELRTIQGVEMVSYRFPNKFIVSYIQGETSKLEILSLDVFNIYQATVIDETTVVNEFINKWQPIGDL